MWYSVVGTGSAFEASLNGTLSLEMSIYTGNHCGALACVASNDRPLFPVDWDSVEGEQYFLYVYTFAGQKDSFKVLVEEVSRPENDQCEAATPIEIDGPVMEGTTSVSSTETDLDFCGEVEDVGYGGVWYSFAGNGEVVLVGIKTD